MTVARDEGRPRHLSDCDWCVISCVCQLEDKPPESGEVSWKKNEVVLCRMWKGNRILAVCQGMAQIQSTMVGSDVLWKKRIDTFGCRVTGEGKGYLTPPAWSTDLPARICNSEQAPWVWKIAPPPFCDGGREHLSIADSGGDEWREIQSSVSLLSNPGETQTPRSGWENKEWQKWSIMNACRNLKVPAFLFRRTGVSSWRGNVCAFFQVETKRKRCFLFGSHFVCVILSE